MEELIKLLYGEYLESWEVEGVKKKNVGNGSDQEIIIEFRERSCRVPMDGLVQKGYYNPLELIDFPARGIGIYMKFYRRRWKDPVSGKEFGNSYNLAFPGTKLTPGFANFLKSEDRGKVYELLNNIPHLRDLIEEDLRVVQKSFVRVRKPWYKRIFV